MADIYQEIWDADQHENGVRPLRGNDPGDASQGFVRVVLGPASPDLKVLRDVTIPAAKNHTYDLVRKLFDNYSLSEADEETETEAEREEIHDLLDAIVDSAPMLVARQFIERATGTSMSASRWYSMLLEMWFRQFSQGGDPDLTGFEHVFVGEQEGSKVQGYHFWYKYFLDDNFANQIDSNPFPGLTNDRIQYEGSFESSAQQAFPESVTISYRWQAPDYDRGAIRPLTKPKGGFFVGCSVEGLMALGTVRAHVAARAPKEAVINGGRYDMKVFRSESNQNVRSFYPVFLGAAPGGAGGSGGTGGGGGGGTGGGTGGSTTGGKLRILAALVNPTGPDPGRESVTLVNIGATAATLQGWRLVDKNRQSYQLPTVTLAPGAAQSFVLPAEHSLQLSNQGGEIRLIDRGGATIHRVSYSKAQASREGEAIVF